MMVDAKLEILILIAIFHVVQCQLYSEKGCRYEFNVWQPDADEILRMRTLEVQYANFTNYVDKELVQFKLQRSNDLEIYRNWTLMYDRSLMDLKTEQLQKYVELQELRVKVGIYEIKLEELKETFENSIYRISNQRAGRRKHSRKDRMLPTYGSQSDTPREQLVGSLKNMVSDLKAEWILLKREFIDMKSDNKNLHTVQNTLYNSSVACHAENSQLREGYKRLETTDDKLENDVDGIQVNMESLVKDLATLKTAQERFKDDVVAIENGLAALQAATVDIRRAVTAIQKQESNVQYSPNKFYRVPVDKGGNTKLDSEQIPKDCGDVAKQGHTMSGLYKVKPATNLLLDYVYCEIIDGVGYTLIQRRNDGLQDFSRGWLEYKIGFGNLYGDFWVGNDFIHALTKNNEYGLLVEMWDWEGNKTSANYDVFMIGDEESRYPLHVSGFQGNAGDSLSYHDGMKFSTKDHDNDLSDRNCAADNKGGWWYRGCYSSNLNGAYHVGWYSPTHSAFADGIVWYALKDSDRYSVRKVEMKIRKEV